jgi:hypothetical protein
LERHPAEKNIEEKSGKIKRKEVSVEIDVHMPSRRIRVVVKRRLYERLGTSPSTCH